MVKNIVLFYFFSVMYCCGELPYPFIILSQLTHDSYECVPETKVNELLQSVYETKSGARCLQFLQYYAAKTNTKICFVYSREEDNYCYLGNSNSIYNTDLNIYFIQIAQTKNKQIPFTYCYFNIGIFSIRESQGYEHFDAGKLIHEIHHYCEEVMQGMENKTLLQQLAQYECNEKLINEGLDTHQQLGCWFIGEFDYLQEIFDSFVFRIYYPECVEIHQAMTIHKIERLTTYLRNHQLDSYFIRPKFYEDINMRNCPQQVANTITFLQQEDFLLEHFALEIPSDGNDAIWAVMQAMLPYENYLPVEVTLSDENEQRTMLYWRSAFAGTAQNANESYTRFSENHHRIKVEDFTYIAQTINRDIIVIEPEDIQFKITVFNDEGTYYSMNKLPKLDQKTLYIYYNGYNHYQPLLLSSKLDATISLKTFLD